MPFSRAARSIFSPCSSEPVRKKTSYLHSLIPGHAVCRYSSVSMTYVQVIAGIVDWCSDIESFLSPKLKTPLLDSVSWAMIGALFINKTPRR